MSDSRISHGSILAAIRKQIVDGELRPGERMPTRRELHDRFGASPITIQRAMELLMAEGFAEARGRLGTFVASRPPHLSRYALVFPGSLSGPSRWWRLLAAHAEQLQRGRPVSIVPYQDTERGIDSPDYCRLLREVESHCLAGLVFVTNPYTLAGTPMLDLPNMPRVAIARGQDEGTPPGLPLICPDYADLQTQCLAELAARRRRRVALLYSPLAVLKNFRGQASSLGLAAPEHWVLPMPIFEPTTVKACVRLLLDPGQKERPDGLILGDDHYVEPVAAAIASLGDSALRDLEIVAHANFPLTVPSPIPMTRIGFDARDMLERCLQCLQLQQAGQGVAPRQWVPSVREADLAAKAN